MIGAQDKDNLKELKFKFATIDVEADDSVAIGLGIIISELTVTFVNDKIFDINVESFTGIKVRMATKETPVTDFWKQNKTRSEYKNLINPNKSLGKDDVYDIARDVLEPYLKGEMVLVVGTTLDIRYLDRINNWLPFKGVFMVRSIAEFLSNSIERPYTVINNNKWISERVRKLINPTNYMFYNEIGEQISINSCHDCLYDAYINACNFVTLSIIRILCCK